jgi:hypothetical protein
MAVGGDIIEITYNHPVLGSGVLFPKAGEDSTYDLGGFKSEDDQQGIDGGGNMIDVMVQGRWSFENTISWDMNTNLELERLNALANSPIQSTWTFTHINGTVYAGKGKVVGDLQGAGNAATFKIKVAGGGTLAKL